MQLLGDGSTPETLEFVDNVGKYKRKEPLNLSSDHKECSKDIETNIIPLPISPSPSADIQSTNPLPPMSQKPTQEAVESRRNQKQNKSRTPPPKKIQQETVKISGERKAAEKSALQVQTQEMVKSSAEGEGVARSGSNVSSNCKLDEQDKVEKLKASRGKAKKICGCFGTFHKPLTNCLYCGRISCTEEGYDFCSFCGYMVDKVDHTLE